MDATNFDQALKSYPQCDPDLSSQVAGVEAVATRRGNLTKRIFNFLANNSTANLTSQLGQVQIQPYNTLNTNILNAGPQGYIDWKMIPIAGALYLNSEVTLTVTNNNANGVTAVLCSAPWMFSKVVTLTGGSENLSSYSTAVSNFIETCLQMEESYVPDPSYMMYGLKSSNNIYQGPFTSNVTIAPWASFSYTIPIITPIFATLLPMTVWTRTLVYQ